jgi:aldose 1-epimerase
LELITLRADGAGLTVAPAVGGAVTRYWLERDGTTWEWLRPIPAEAVRDHRPDLASAFPLVPYSNRIREGRFTFRDRAVVLPLNRPPERHAIHGHGWQSAWCPVHVGPAEVRLEYRHAASAWPWPYRATQHFTLTPARLTVTLTLTSEGDTPMPAGLGWHPYFPRTRRTTITADVRSPLDYLVVFTPPGRPFFCAEPVSHVTDAFNLADAGRADTGRQVLEPGATIETAITLAPRA